MTYTSREMEETAIKEAKSGNWQMLAGIMIDHGRFQTTEARRMVCERLREVEPVE